MHAFGRREIIFFWFVRSVTQFICTSVENQTEEFEEWKKTGLLYVSSLDTSPISSSSSNGGEQHKHVHAEHVETKRSENANVRKESDRKHEKFSLSSSSESLWIYLQHFPSPIKCHYCRIFQKKKLANGALEAGLKKLDLFVLQTTQKHNAQMDDNQTYHLANRSSCYDDKLHVTSQSWSKMPSWERERTSSIQWLTLHHRLSGDTQDRIWCERDPRGSHNSSVITLRKWKPCKRA